MVYTKSANRKRIALQAVNRAQLEHKTLHLDASAGKNLKKSMISKEEKGVVRPRGIEPLSPA